MFEWPLGRPVPHGVLVRARRVAALAIGLLSLQCSFAQIAVGEGGAPSYSQAIGVPPGISGMSPNVGLFYSGGGVNGPVGHGWSIQGISTITRCPSIKAIDGSARSVEYSSADKLCLDGQRLIQTDAAGTPAAFPQANDSLGGSGLVREYRTEKDSYSRIRAYGSASGVAANGPAYFKVWTKSGQVYEYGNNANSTANAAIAIQGKTAISAWAVSRISDTLGSYIDFQYEQRDISWGSGSTSGSPTPGHEWNLVEIRYTGTPTQQAANRVVFEYADRPDAPGAGQDRSEAYHQGAKNVSVRRLVAIRTYTNWPANVALWPAAPPATAIKVKAIKLTYDQGPVSKRSRVTKIQECTGSAESACLPPVTFNYAAGGNESYVPNTAFASSALATTKLHSLDGTTGIILLDFDADGRTDFIRWSDTPAQNELYRSNGDGTFTKITSGTLPGQFNLTTQNLYKSDGCYASVVADFNGDGLPDILRYTNNFSATNATCVSPGSPVLYQGNGDGSFTQRAITGVTLQRSISLVIQGCPPNGAPPRSNGLCPNTDPPSPTGWTVGHTFYLLDIDADGKLDIVTADLPFQNGSSFADPCASIVCTRVFKGDGNGGFVEIAGVNVANKVLYAKPDAVYTVGQPSRTADIDGDGLSDIIGIDNPYFQLVGGIGIQAWRSRGDGNFDAIAAPSVCDYPIDFNGDGRADCLNAKSRTLRVSQGPTNTGSVADFNLTAIGTELDGTGIGIVVADINGDGRSDILRWKDDPTQNVVYLSNGEGRFTASPTFTSSFNTAANQLRKSDGTVTFVVGDFSGRGTLEILRLKDNPTTGAATSNQLFNKSDTAQPDQLISFTSASGLTTSLTWAPLSNSASGSLGARYSSDRGGSSAAVFPAVDLTLPMHVVVTSESATGVGSSTIKTEYSYAGLKAAYDGRGSQGFRETRRQSPGAEGSDLTVVTRFLQAFPYIGVAHTTETYLGALNALPAGPISRSTFTYCEKSALAGSEAAASPAAPCAVPATTRVQRPYLYKSIEQGWELPANGGAALPTVTTTNVFNDTGDPTSISVSTDGTALGLAQSVSKTTTNQYYTADTAGDNWVLGRLQRSSQQNSVPNSLGSIAVGYGSAPLANATQGQGSVFSLTAPSFPSTQVGLNTTANAVLTNNGTATGSVVIPTASSVTGADFSFVSTTCSTSLAAGASCTTAVRFAPTGTGNRTGTLSLQTQAGSKTVGLSGTGIAPPTASISPSALTVNATGPGVASGAVTGSASGGVPPFTYLWTRLAGTRSSISSTTVANPTISATLGSGENFTETWRLTATDAASNAANANVNVTFTSPASSTLSLSPTSVSLTRSGGLTIQSAAITLSNGGPSPVSALTWNLVRTSGTVGDAYVVSSTCGTLASGSTCTFKIEFASGCPTAATSRWTLNITGSGAANTAALAITGNTGSGACQ